MHKTLARLTNNIGAGARYQNYIAWLLKQDGWEVDDRFRYGVYDRGIDLIATRGAETRYIQCKGWKWWKHIHENAIFQLFGAVAAIEGTKRLPDIEMYVYTSATLTPYAHDKAKTLNIHVKRIGLPRKHKTIAQAIRQQ